MDQQAPPVELGTQTRRSLERVAYVVAAHRPTVLLSAVAVALLNLMFVAAILQYCWYRPSLILSYLATVLFYAALYFRRRLLRHRRAALLRRGLGYAAIVLGAFVSAALLCSLAAAGTPMSVSVGVWLVIAVAAYFFYRVTVLHLEDDEEQLQQAQARPLV